MEKNLRKCKVCLVVKPRILVGKFNHKDKKYTDGDNLCWNGNTCGTCHRVKIKQNMRKLRKK